MNFEILRGLAQPAETKIVLLVMDGLGGLPLEPGGLTELEAARTPNMDQLASQGICGLHQPIATGITPGSGPAHLALFGYDPLHFQVGRGVLSALGVDFDLTIQDVAARGNFATVNEQGIVVDRRAGRISTAVNQELTKQLREIELPDVETFIQPVKEHRFLFVLRGRDLVADIADTDPQAVNRHPLPPRALSPGAENTVRLVAQFIDEARQILASQHPANMVLLRGFSKRPDWPSLKDIYGLRAAAIAPYPMYRGVARLIGMQPLPTGETLVEQFAALKEHWDDFDFFFLHFKDSDSAGEDGDFDRKVAAIEQMDTMIPGLLELDPDVILATGDHTTPAQLKLHSWHPVPVLLWSRHCRSDDVQQFGERACVAGSLGPRLPAVELMPLALANAMRLKKFGA